MLASSKVEITASVNWLILLLDYYLIKISSGLSYWQSIKLRDSRYLIFKIIPVLTLGSFFESSGQWRQSGFKGRAVVRKRPSGRGAKKLVNEKKKWLNDLLFNKNILWIFHTGKKQSIR